MAKMHNLGFELLPHPPYSPDLAPCDFHLFPNVKKLLRGKKFSGNAEIIAAVNSYFEGLDKYFYKNGNLALENGGDKCLYIKEGYVLKKKLI